MNLNHLVTHLQTVRYNNQTSKCSQMGANDAVSPWINCRFIFIEPIQMRENAFQPSTCVFKCIAISERFSSLGSNFVHDENIHKVFTELGSEWCKLSHSTLLLDCRFSEKLEESSNAFIQNPPSYKSMQAFPKVPT